MMHSMGWQDIVNGTLELSGGIIIWYNVRALWHERGYAGETILVALFFALLSSWRLYFYLHLSQPMSLMGEAPRALANYSYIVLMLRFGKKK